VFSDDGKLMLLDADTRATRPLLSIEPDKVAEWNFVISPDDQHIFFSRSSTEADVWVAELRQ
jgi:hypothetical protein